MPEDPVIHAAYFYLLGRCLAIQQEHVDTRVTDYNVIKYNPLGTASADFVNPNMDVAYWEAWIAVDDDHPVILTIPEIKDRYFTVQVMDGWAEVIANINERTFPASPWGPVAFVAPGSAAPVPDQAVRVELPGGKGKILGRVELSTSASTAVELQHAFALSVPGGIRPTPPPDLPGFPSPQLPDAWIFQRAGDVLASCPDSMPQAPQLQGQVREVAAYAASSPAALDHLQDLIDSTLKPYLFQLIATRPQRGGWAIMDSGGRFGNDYELRALCNFGGIWANVPEEALYYTIHHDAAGSRLSGSDHYALKFAPGALPDDACSAFWSLTMLRMPDYRAVPNATGRCTINNTTGSRTAPDGSLTLHISPQLPEGIPPANWLPSPAQREITMTFRLYCPSRDALEQKWFVPPLDPD